MWGNATGRGGPAQLPSVVEVRLESYQQVPLGSDPAHEAPFLLLLLADGSFLAYKAFHTPQGNVRFARLSLPAFAHRPPLESWAQSRPSSSMTRFDGLGERTAQAADQSYRWNT